MKNSNVSVIPTLPSRNSSNDNVFTDAHPTDIQSECLYLAKNMDALPSDSNSRADLAEDRELQTATFPRINEVEAVISENLPNEQCANETSTNRSVLGNESNVSMENHVSNDSRIVEEKFHFDSGEKFEGKDLVKWLISADHDHSDEPTLILDAEQLCLKICGRLVNAGILVSLANESSSKVIEFTPNLTYQWAHERKESRKIEVSKIDGPTPTNFIPPPPPASGGNLSIGMRKKKICPSVPMNSLYWTRILLPVVATTGLESPSQKSVWSDIEEDESVNIEKFTGLFSSKRNQPKDSNEKHKPTKIQRINVLDIKRAKAVGIFVKSSRCNFEEIKTAIHNLDTSVVDLEMIKRIYDIRPTEQEVEEISALVQEHPDIPLGDPENFLKQLSSIPQFAERITCLLFQSKFRDAIFVVSSRLTNLRSTCEYLRNSDALKKVIAIILTLGNYMNGGHPTRGQADGFRLEILGNLKDVKSHIPGTTLLHFVVRTSLVEETQRNFDAPRTLPIPEPDSIKAAATIKFGALKNELEELGKELDDCITKCKAVAASDPENSSPFEEKMEAFTNSAVVELRDAKKKLENSVQEFKGIMQYYRCIPQGMDLDSAEPCDFFPLWEDFCNDFKNIWTEEEKNSAEQRLREKRRKTKDKRECRRSKKENKKCKNQLWRHGAKK